MNIGNKKEKVNVNNNVNVTANNNPNVNTNVNNNVNNNANATVSNNNPSVNTNVQGGKVVVNMDSASNNVNKKSDKPVKIRFKYTIKDGNGVLSTGYFDAFSKIDVHSFLMSQGYEVVNIEEDRMSTKLGLASMAPRKRMRAKELSFFLTQLSTYIKSGIPLVDSVAILSRQTKKKKDKYLYQRLVFELSKGSSFSDAIEMQGNIFPRLVINMVKTSELTGDLTTILDDLANYYKEQNATRKQIISAMTYPSVVFIFAIAIISFIFIYVVPQFVDIYAQAGTDLPLITVVIMNISSYMQANYILIFVLAVAIIAAIVVLYRSVASFRRICQTILMHIPVFKNIIMYNEVIMFTSTFASLINHDVFITDSMEILKTISNNEIYKSLIEKAIDNLALGDGVSKAFQGHWAFPTTAYEMLVTGERTGRLGPMMQTVAEYYQEEQKALVTQMKSLIEPIMIVFLAIIVGITLLSIVIPMFTMYGNVL